MFVNRLVGMGLYSEVLVTFTDFPTLTFFLPTDDVAIAVGVVVPIVVIALVVLAVLLFMRSKNYIPYLFLLFFYFYCISRDNSVLPDIPIDNGIYILEFLLSLYKSSLG